MLVDFPPEDPIHLPSPISHLTTPMISSPTPCSLLPAPKPKFPRAAALSVARELCILLRPACDQIIVAGSLRRMKPEVGDVEILFIPKEYTEPDGLFDQVKRFRSDQILETCLQNGLLAKRKSSAGSDSWGPKNKLAIHCETGIPVDLFHATHRNWFNYLVCRTGSSQNNIRIASEAKNKGWKWHPYDSGFTDNHGNPVTVHSESEVFSLLGLPYLDPKDR